LSDFGLLSESGRAARAIKRFTIRPDVSCYLAYDLHFAGLSDMTLAATRIGGYSGSTLRRWWAN